VLRGGLGAVLADAGACRLELARLALAPLAVALLALV
jgi:hypothetical protein